MSRIGNRVLEIPKDVRIEVSKGNMLTITGPKGELKQQIDQDLKVNVEDTQVTIERPTEQKRHKAHNGMYNSLDENMLTGVSEGFKHERELGGVGFRVTDNVNFLELRLGYLHPIIFFAI